MMKAAKATEAPRLRRGRPTLESVSVIEARLIDVALHEFIAHGYGGASLSQIIRDARVSKTTLYSRYASKEELFRAVVRNQIERLAAATTLTASSAPLGLEEGLIAYANRTLEISFTGQLLAVNRLIYSESLRFPELGVAAAERTEVGIAQVAFFLERSAAKAERPIANPRDLAETFILMLRGWYVNAMLAHRNVSASEREAFTRRAVEALLHGWSA